MADGLTIEIRGEKAAQVEAGARERGLSPAEFASQLLERALEDETDRAEIGRRWTAFVDTGETIDHQAIIEILRQRAAGASE